MSMLNQFIEFNEDLEEGDKLARFFNVMESFNHNVPMPYETKRNIEDHFKYKWLNDKNLAFKDDSDVDILE